MVPWRLVCDVLTEHLAGQPGVLQQILDVLAATTDIGVGKERTG